VRFSRSPALLVTLAALVLTACGGGRSAGSLLPAEQPSSLGTLHASKHNVKATIRITIPKREHRRRVLVHGHYVSAATKSIAIAVTPPGGATIDHNADLTPASNPNCAGSPVVCTLTLALPPGSYTATFATYDGLLNGSSAPTGNELSANQSVPLTMVVGKNNVINLTLDGVPASVAVVPAAGSTLGGNMASGFTLAKCSSPPQTVSVLGVDADHNDILGPGAPTPSLASNKTDLPITATPSANSPNAFVLTPPAVATGNEVVQLTATVTAGSASGAPAQTARVNVTYSADLCGVMTEYPVPTSGSLPNGIAAGPDGAVWFTEEFGNKIGRITADVSPAITEYLIPTSGSRPAGITAGPDGALWFTEVSGGKIGRITTGASPAITEYLIPTASSAPEGITAGPDRALWFTEGLGDKIGRITTGATPAITEYSVPTSGSHPAGITAGPDGALWFTENSADKIGRITTGATPAIADYPVPTAGSQPQGITAGPDGALWFTECNGDKIGRITTGAAPATTEYPIPTSGSFPVGITSGPQGALWFAECNGDKIGRITTSAVPAITEYPALTSTSFPLFITVGPDGALWFTEEANKIGRLQ
jgi:virginiamycin B lyase